MDPNFQQPNPIQSPDSVTPGMLTAVVKSDPHRLTFQCSEFRPVSSPLFPVYCFWWQQTEIMEKMIALRSLCRSVSSRSYRTAAVAANQQLTRHPQPHHYSASAARTLFNFSSPNAKDLSSGTPSYPFDLIFFFHYINKS